MTDAQLHVLLANIAERLDAAIAAAELRLPDELSVVPEVPEILKPMEKFLDRQPSYPVLETFYDLQTTLHDELKLLERAIEAKPVPPVEVVGGGRLQGR